MEGEPPPMLGRRVAVYGGANTAMDAALTAKRLGAREAIVVYRIDLGFCEGCGICVAECPCGAVEMPAEEV
jgi:NADPH-dependent glutamate synthase beta subunit-like oxidoreductase